MTTLRYVLVTALLAGPAVVAFACSSGDVAAPSAGDARVDGGADGPPCSQMALPSGAPITITGRVVATRPDGGDAGDAADGGDAGDEPGLPNTLVVAEWGGIYIPYCDLTHASPYYLFGAVTDKDGRFEMVAREGALGFHGFTDGHYYARGNLVTRNGTDITIHTEVLPAAQKLPTLENVGFDKNDVAAGAEITLSATIATYDKNDPLSDEIVVVEPSTSWGVELDPPKEGKKDDFSDGVWKRTFAAPQKAGIYTYWLSATTSGCVNTNLAKATLQVR